MRLLITACLCEGSGICAACHPQAFALGDDGYAKVIDSGFGIELSPQERDEIMALCPFGAINYSDGRQ